MTGWSAEVSRWWAGLLRVPEQALRTGGLFPARHLDHAGVLMVRGADGPLAYGPPRALPILRAALPDAGTNPVLDGERWAQVFPQARLLGPAWYGYAGRASVVQAGNAAVRPLAETDLPALARLHEQVPPAEVEESGTEGLPAFGYLRGDALLAVACLGAWQHMPTIGVLTHPQARGRGLGGLVVSAATAAGLQQRAVVQYRAWHVNAASISLAIRVGFSHYCDSLVIDLPRRG